MHTKVTDYEVPAITDYGDLTELTAGCLGGTEGDEGYPAEVGGYKVGPSNPADGCESNP